MKKIDNFVNCYGVSKTLKFKAIPVGKTDNKIKEKKLLEEDKQRADDYILVKKILDKYHRFFINDVLSKVKLANLDEYFLLYFKTKRSDEDNKKLEGVEALLRKEISDAFQKDERYKYLSAGTPDKLLKKILPDFLSDKSEIELVNSFKKFSTALRGYCENRKNLYVPDQKSTSVAYRIIDDNLPRFASNVGIYEKIKDILKDEEIKLIEDNIIKGTYELKDFFSKDFYENVMMQQDIDIYNYIIGGIELDDKTKIQGLNELINLHNQDTKDRLPQLKKLLKQIMSDRVSLSFKGKVIESDEEVIKNFTSILNPKDDTYKIYTKVQDAESLFSKLPNFDLNGIYIKNSFISTLSNDVYGSWNNIQDGWYSNYDKMNMKKKIKDFEEYAKKRRNIFEKNESFSIEFIDMLMDSEIDISAQIPAVINKLVSNVNEAYEKASALFEPDYELNKSLSKDEKTVEIIKNVLDSLKKLENYLKAFKGTEKEEYRDEIFYGEFVPIIDAFEPLNALYIAIRNYVTKKPYSMDKFKLYFQNPQFMNGWDINKENDYTASILLKDNKYFLAVMDNDNRNVLQLEDSEYIGDSEKYSKMIYKQIPQAAKYLSIKQIKPQNPPAEILRLLDNKKSGTLNEKERNTFITYLIDDFLVNYPMLKNKEGEPYFNFKFKKVSEYKNLGDFFKNIENQAYSISYENISSKYVDKMVEEGKIYLFEIYSKDFSEKSHGIENLNTMYFKMLFDVKNTGNIRLSGEAELFMRKASLKKSEVACHPANQAMTNKNPDNPKKTTVLPYDLYKNKRFTEDQYEIHLPISFNKVPSNPIKINSEVRKALRNDENPYVIGIDRGERNLLYIVVIDYKGNIVEQYSLNDIINECNGIKITTDYHKLLDEKEKLRLAARKNWTTIENIKELKEGYISQVVHKICQLVYKYDAVIALEDLNSRFKNSRVKVEKQVYQKFEKMLIEKLNYMADKHIDKYSNGGILRGYQLTNEFSSFKTMGTQNGFMFYIPAWLTSKIDPATGFVNLLRTRYTSIKDSQNLIMSFDKISYDEKKKMFKFELDYNKFQRADADYNKKWTLYSNSDRIHTFRNPEMKNQFDYKVINLTESFIELFDKYNINYTANDLRHIICERNEKDFYESFLRILSLMLQMRNSITGRTDVDYLISPVMNANGEFYDSRNYQNMDNAILPKDADANGAYNIARKVLWAIEQFKSANEEELDKTKIAISNKEWLKYAQTHCK